MKTVTLSEMLDFCESNRGNSGFCRCSSSCSGASISNLERDYPFPKGVTVYRGGRHGSCRFLVKEDPKN